MEGTGTQVNHAMHQVPSDEPRMRWCKRGSTWSLETRVYDLGVQIWREWHSGYREQHEQACGGRKGRATHREGKGVLGGGESAREGTGGRKEVGEMSQSLTWEGLASWVLRAARKRLSGLLQRCTWPGLPFLDSELCTGNIQNKSLLCCNLPESEEACAC